MPAPIDPHVSGTAWSPTADPAAPWWGQKVYFDGVPTTRAAVADRIAAVPGMTAAAARAVVEFAEPVEGGDASLRSPWYWDARVYFDGVPTPRREAARKLAAAGVPDAHAMQCLDTAAKFAAPPEGEKGDLDPAGHWRTVQGQHIHITGDGQIDAGGHPKLVEALVNSGKLTVKGGGGGDKAVGPAKDPGFTIQPARYAKGQVAIRSNDGSGIKTAAGRIAEAMGARYSNREKSYILPAAKAERFKALVAQGWQANPVSGHLSPPKGLHDAAVSGKGTSFLHQRWKEAHEADQKPGDLNQRQRKGETVEPRTTAEAYEDAKRLNDKFTRDVVRGRFDGHLGVSTPPKAAKAPKEAEPDSGPKPSAPTDYDDPIEPSVRKLAEKSESSQDFADRLKRGEGVGVESYVRTPGMPGGWVRGEGTLGKGIDAWKVEKPGGGFTHVPKAGAEHMHGVADPHGYHGSVSTGKAGRAAAAPDTSDDAAAYAKAQGMLKDIHDGGSLKVKTPEGKEFTIRHKLDKAGLGVRGYAVEEAGKKVKGTDYKICDRDEMLNWLGSLDRAGGGPDKGTPTGPDLAAGATADDRRQHYSAEASRLREVVMGSPRVDRADLQAGDHVYDKRAGTFYRVDKVTASGQVKVTDLANPDARSAALTKNRLGMEDKLYKLAPEAARQSADLHIKIFGPRGQADKADPAGATEGKPADEPAPAEHTPEQKAYSKFEKATAERVKGVPAHQLTWGEYTTTPEYKEAAGRYAKHLATRMPRYADAVDPAITYARKVREAAEGGRAVPPHVLGQFAKAGGELTAPLTLAALHAKAKAGG